MEISVLSSSSSYHHIAQKFLNENNKVNHYGASDDLLSTELYCPIPVDLPISRFIEDQEIALLIESLSCKKSDFVIASGIPLCRKQLLHTALSERNIPYFFTNAEFTVLEIDKSKTKKMLEHLKIPTPNAKAVDGKFLFDNFFELPRPFVVKLNGVFHYGRQTVIVTDENVNEIYLDFFSIYANKSPRIFNISFNTNVTLEQFVKLKREYSYHLVANRSGWKYLGSARDYKKMYDNDIGHNTLGMGAYNIDDIDSCVHDYADKILKFLNEYVKMPYKGFMFLGIGVDENDNHMILEINTRSGNPEIQVILDSIDNNLSEFFLQLSEDAPIPEIEHNNKKSVTVRIMNKIFDWNKPVVYAPSLSSPPEDIVVSLEGGSESRISHSAITSQSESTEISSQKIYDYLSKQSLGQFFYRKDIGILK